MRIEGYQAGYPDWGVASANGGNGSHFVFSTGAARFSFYPNDLTFSLFDHAVAGNVELQEMVVSPTGKQVTFQLISGATVVETRTANLDGSGNYYFSTNRTGLYDITAKASHWLRQRVYDVDLSAAGASGVMFSLVNGDVDNDNEITLADYGILSAAFGTALGDPTYDARADLNGDDEVNLADYAILARNFGLAGD